MSFALNNNDFYGSKKYITFQMDEDIFGIEIEKVIEIVGHCTIKEMPDAPDYVKGVIVLRGEIIPVLDTYMKFKKERPAKDGVESIIIIDVDNKKIGLLIEKIREVLELNSENILPRPDLDNSAGLYIKNIGLINEQMYLLLDNDLLLKEASELEAMQE